MGLGSTRDVTLDEARDAAIDANRLIAKGTNPRDVRDQAQQAQASVLFGKFAEELRQTKEKGFRNEAHKTKWRYNVQIRFKPLHSKRIDRSQLRTCWTSSSRSGWRHRLRRATPGLS
jgi:oligoendopeptidase F